MSGAQYLRQLLSPLGVYDLEGPFQNGELEALGAGSGSGGGRAG